MTQPLIYLDPFPLTREMVYTEDTQDALSKLGRVFTQFGAAATDDEIQSILPDVDIIIGQTPMPMERLEKATRLQAIICLGAERDHIVDHAGAKRKGVHVLYSAPLTAPAIAEFCLGQAIDLSRGANAANVAFRMGHEQYGVNWGRRHFGLAGEPFGIIGYGASGKALSELLRPFGGRILVHDPTLSDEYLRGHHGVEPVDLDTLLADSRIICMLSEAPSTRDNFLDRTRLCLIREDAAFILASRPDMVDFETLAELGGMGRLRVAIDVFPQEPIPKNHPVRKTPRVMFSPRIAESLPRSYAAMRAAIVDDIAQILSGKRPMQLQRSQLN